MLPICPYVHDIYGAVFCMMECAHSMTVLIGWQVERVCSRHLGTSLRIFWQPELIINFEYQLNCCLVFVLWPDSLDAMFWIIFKPFSAYIFFIVQHSHIEIFLLAVCEWKPISNIWVIFELEAQLVKHVDRAYILNWWWVINCSSFSR